MKINKKQTTRIEKTIQLDREDILDYLIYKGVITKFLNKCDIFIRIPGGGDWSNTNLDIDNTNPIIVDIEYEEN